MNTKITSSIKNGVQPMVLFLFCGITLLVATSNAENPSTPNPKWPRPRHEIFAEDVKKGKYDFSEGPYICAKYGDHARDDVHGTREYCGCKILPTRDGFHYPYPALKDIYRCPNLLYQRTCGNGYFNQLKYCAIATFFEGQTKPIIAGDNLKYKRALLLINGCVVCARESKVTGLKVTHYEADGGSFWSNCEEEQEHVDFDAQGLDIHVPKSGKGTKTASFTVPTVVSHRICDNLFSIKGPEDVFTGLKLHITHTCDGQESTTVVDLPDLDLTKTKETNVVEMDGFWLDLNDKISKKQQYVESNDAVELKSDLQWEVADLNGWHGDTENECLLDKK